MIATVYCGQNLASSLTADIEPITPDVGRMTCLECGGDPEGHAPNFGDQQQKTGAGW